MRLRPVERRFEHGADGGDGVAVCERSGASFTVPQSTAPRIVPRASGNQDMPYRPGAMTPLGSSARLSAAHASEIAAVRWP